jgi:hypothetical protein
MRYTVTRSIICALAFSILGTSTPVLGQSLTVGGHGGANVSNHRPTKLIGLELAWQMSPHLRLRGIGTSEIEEPGSAYFVGSAMEWHPLGGWFQPYIGGGATLASYSTGWASDNDSGWLMVGGIEAATRIGTPYLELRVLGVGGTSGHVVAGFRLTP